MPPDKSREKIVLLIQTFQHIKMYKNVIFPTYKHPVKCSFDQQNRSKEEALFHGRPALKKTAFKVPYQSIPVDDFQTRVPWYYQLLMVQHLARFFHPNTSRHRIHVWYSVGQHAYMDTMGNWIVWIRFDHPPFSSNSPHHDIYLAFWKIPGFSWSPNLHM